MTVECLDKNECCGCSSCAQKCPQKAIKMKENLKCKITARKVVKAVVPTSIKIGIKKLRKVIK